MTRYEAFAVFVHWAQVIWSQKTIDRLQLELVEEEPAGGYLASLAYHGKTVAIDQHLIRPADPYRLRVADRLLAQGPEVIDKIMIHEAVHIGYHAHGEEFRRIVRKYGGAVTEAALTTGILVERKEGARYKTIATFEDEREARAWMNAEFRRNPGRYRLSM